MPAIASLEDLKAAQKEGFWYLREDLNALCAMLYEMAQDRLEECL